MRIGTNLRRVMLTIARMMGGDGCFVVSVFRPCLSEQAYVYSSLHERK